MTAPEPLQPPQLIETMRVESGGHMPLLTGHIARLHRSSQQLAYVWPGEGAIRHQVAEAVDRLNPGASWRLRLLLTADGALSLETSPLGPTTPPLQVVVRGPRIAGSETYLRHKTTHRPWYESAQQWLTAHPEIFDVLYWDEDQQMTEGSRSNLYIQAGDGRWLTPPVHTGVLPGVQRQALLDAGLVETAEIGLNEFLQASAWRISNALRGWVDVVLVAEP